MLRRFQQESSNRLKAENLLILWYRPDKLNSDLNHIFAKN